MNKGKARRLRKERLDALSQIGRLQKKAEGHDPLGAIGYYCQTRIRVLRLRVGQIEAQIDLNT